MTVKRLVKMFKELVEIDSVSTNEKEIHDHMKKCFHSLGLHVQEDDSAKHTGLGANNLIATLKGNSRKQGLFFSAHTDTVEPGVGIEVIEKDGILYSKGKTILGADNKAGLAIMLEAISRVKENNIETGDIEFILTPGEEIGLIGSSALESDLIRSEFGYVLDSPKSVGHVTTASPHMYMYEIQLIGKSAHAGIEPEKGISCVSILRKALTTIPLGRLDRYTTTNIGVIEGGNTTNVIMDKLIVKGEVRAVYPEKAIELLTKIESDFNTAATELGGEIIVNSQKMAEGFNISNQEPVMELLIKASENLGYDLISEVSGGGSDANSFNSKGKKAVNLSIGYEDMHTTSEFIPIEEMEKSVNLVIELMKNSPIKE